MEELVEQAKQGNKEAFSELIKQIQNDIYKIAKIRLSNDEDVEDALQETILIALKSIKKLKDNNYFKTWFIKILMNECNKIYRKRKNNFEEIAEDVQLFNVIDSKRELETVNSKISLETILKNLKYEERIILILYYGEDYSAKEIAEMLKLNQSTVKSKVLRIKNKVKKMYKEDETWMN